MQSLGWFEKDSVSERGFTKPPGSGFLRAHVGYLTRPVLSGTYKWVEKDERSQSQSHGVFTPFRGELKGFHVKLAVATFGEMVLR